MTPRMVPCTAARCTSGKAWQQASQGCVTIPAAACLRRCVSGLSAGTRCWAEVDPCCEQSPHTPHAHDAAQVVRYHGAVHFAAGDYVGVELFNGALRNVNTGTDGSVDGVTYFSPSSANAAIFVRDADVEQAQPAVPAPSGATLLASPTPGAPVGRATGYTPRTLSPARAAEKAWNSAHGTAAKYRAPHERHAFMRARQGLGGSPTTSRAASHRAASSPPPARTSSGPVSQPRSSSTSRSRSKSRAGSSAHHAQQPARGPGAPSRRGGSRAGRPAWRSGGGKAPRSRAPPARGRRASTKPPQPRPQAEQVYGSAPSSPFMEVPKRRAAVEKHSQAIAASRAKGKRAKDPFVTAKRFTSAASWSRHPPSRRGPPKVHHTPPSRRQERAGDQAPAQSPPRQSPSPTKQPEQSSPEEEDAPTSPEWWQRQGLGDMEEAFAAASRGEGGGRQPTSPAHSRRTDPVLHPLRPLQSSFGRKPPSPEVGSPRQAHRTASPGQDHAAGAALPQHTQPDVSALRGADPAPGARKPWVLQHASTPGNTRVQRAHYSARSPPNIGAGSSTIRRRGSLSPGSASSSAPPLEEYDESTIKAHTESTRGRGGSPHSQHSAQGIHRATASTAAKAVHTTARQEWTRRNSQTLQRRAGWRGAGAASSRTLQRRAASAPRALGSVRGRQGGGSPASGHRVVNGQVMRRAGGGGWVPVSPGGQSETVGAGVTVQEAVQSRKARRALSTGPPRRAAKPRRPSRAGDQVLQERSTARMIQLGKLQPTAVSLGGLKHTRPHSPRTHALVRDRLGLPPKPKRRPGSRASTPTSPQAESAPPPPRRQRNSLSIPVPPGAGELHAGTGTVKVPPPRIGTAGAAILGQSVGGGLRDTSAVLARDTLGRPMSAARTSRITAAYEADLAAGHQDSLALGQAVEQAVTASPDKRLAPAQAMQLSGAALLASPTPSRPRYTASPLAPPKATPVPAESKPEAPGSGGGGVTMSAAEFLAASAAPRTPAPQPSKLEALASSVSLYGSSPGSDEEEGGESVGLRDSSVPARGTGAAKDPRPTLMSPPNPQHMQGAYAALSTPQGQATLQAKIQEARGLVRDSMSRTHTGSPASTAAAEAAWAKRAADIKEASAKFDAQSAEIERLLNSARSVLGESSAILAAREGQHGSGEQEEAGAPAQAPKQPGNAQLQHLKRLVSQAQGMTQAAEQAVASVKQGASPSDSVSSQSVPSGFEAVQELVTTTVAAAMATASAVAAAGEQDISAEEAAGRAAAGDEKPQEGTATPPAAEAVPSPDATLVSPQKPENEPAQRDSGAEEEAAGTRPGDDSQPAPPVGSIQEQTTPPPKQGSSPPAPKVERAPPATAESGDSPASVGGALQAAAVARSPAEPSTPSGGTPAQSSEAKPSPLSKSGTKPSSSPSTPSHPAQSQADKPRSANPQSGTAAAAPFSAASPPVRPLRPPPARPEAGKTGATEAPKPSITPSKRKAGDSARAMLSAKKPDARSPKAAAPPSPATPALPSPSPPRAGAPVQYKVLAYAGICEKGHNEDEPLKPNQDNVIMSEHPETDSVLLGVMDGHGLYGHEVSAALADGLPQIIFAHPIFLEAVESFAAASSRSATPSIPPHGTSSAQDLPPAHATFANAVSGVMAEAVAEIEDALLSNSELDLSRSGSTLVLALVHQGFAVVANIGDSRMVIAAPPTGQRPCAITAVTSDHKPNAPGETKRILLAGGCVRAITYEDGQDGPMRVWTSMTSEAPGLAMSRSVCDSLGKTCGVTSDPDFFYVALGPGASHLILASDGLFEFVSHETVADTLAMTHKAALVQVADDHSQSPGVDAKALLTGDLASATPDAALRQALAKQVDEEHLKLAIDALADTAVQHWVDEEGVVDDISILLCCCGPARDVDQPGQDT